MRTEHLQSAVEIAAAVLLVPALIAGIYGANTELPGGGEWTGFAAMMIVMVVGATLALFLIRRVSARHETRRD